MKTPQEWAAEIDTTLNGSTYWGDIGEARRQRTEIIGAAVARSQHEARASAFEEVVTMLNRRIYNEQTLIARLRNINMAGELELARNDVVRMVEAIAKARP